MYYQVKFFVIDHDTFEDAEKCKAVHSTSSTIDALSGQSGFYDVAEVIGACLECLSMPVNVGVVNGIGLFVPFDFIYQQLNEQGSDAEIHDIIESFAGHIKFK